MSAGMQRGLHRPKAGCWGCRELFLWEAEVWVEGENLHQPPGVMAAFRQWAERGVVAHDPNAPVLPPLD